MTITETVPEVTTAECHLCGKAGAKSAMTTNRSGWYCGQWSRDPEAKAAYVMEVAACTQRWMDAEAAAAAEEYERGKAALEAAEQPQGEPGGACDCQDAPQAPAPAEDAPEPVADAGECA